MALWQRIRQTRLEHAIQGVQKTLQSRVKLKDEQDGQHLVQIMRYVLKQDSNCIDIGAHNGGFLRYMVECAPRGKHWAIEPLPHYAKLLREKFPSVTVHQTALSDAPGQAAFHYVHDDPGLSGLKRRADLTSQANVETLSVELKRLDDLIPAGTTIAFIKIDVEGAEYQVFRGAMRLLRESRPYIVFEHGRGAAEAFNTTSDMIHDLLAGELGLKLFMMTGGDPLSKEKFGHIVHAQTAWNFLARPY